MKRKLVKILAVPLLLLLGVGVTAFCLQQNASLEEQLEQEKKQKYELMEELNRLEGELERWIEKYERLSSETRNGTPDSPGESNPGGSGPIAYLTFDDGPSNTTLKILDILKNHGIGATFFVTGNNKSGDPDIYKRIVAEGHALGNHTFSHNFEKIYESVETFMEDFLRLEDFLWQQTGVRTRMMRFPGGSRSMMAREVSGYDIIDDLIKEIRDRGYDYFDWNVNSGDGTALLEPEELLENVKKGAERVRGDMVILFHDLESRRTTAEALPGIIKELERRGYEFLPLSPGAIDMKHR